MVFSFNIACTPSMDLGFSTSLFMLLEFGAHPRSPWTVGYDSSSGVSAPAQRCKLHDAVVYSTLILAAADFSDFQPMWTLFTDFFMDADQITGIHLSKVPAWTIEQ